MRSSDAAQIRLATPGTYCPLGIKIHSEELY
jgi:hypothetical protein